MARYPAVKEDIFFAEIETPTRVQVKIHDTATKKDFRLTPDTVFLLTLCTGTSTVEEITSTLSEKSGEPIRELSHPLEKILAKLQEKGIIIMNETPRARTAQKEIAMEYPLESAQIEITNKCNLSCVHCFNNSGNPYPNELTTPEILSLLDTLSSMGVYHVTITGGEPLTHPDLFTIVEHARKEPMSVNIFTNGTLITEDIVRKFKKVGINRFNISIDSLDESIHDTFRGKKGVLKKTLKAVHLLKKAGFSIKISVSLSQWNKEGIADVLKYCKENNLQGVEILPVIYSGRGVKGLAVSPEEYYCALVERFTYMKEEFPEGILKIHEKMEEGCDIARNSIGIKADGTILACPGCDKDMGLGNVRDTNVKKLWEEDETLEVIRSTKAKNDAECAHCRWVAFCEGCIAGAFTLERTLRCYYPYRCAVYRAYDMIIGFE